MQSLTATTFAGESTDEEISLWKAAGPTAVAPAAANSEKPVKRVRFGTVTVIPITPRKVESETQLTAESIPTPPDNNGSSSAEGDPPVRSVIALSHNSGWSADPFLPDQSQQVSVGSSQAHDPQLWGSTDSTPPLFGANSVHPSMPSSLPLSSQHGTPRAVIIADDLSNSPQSAPAGGSGSADTEGTTISGDDESGLMLKQPSPIVITVSSGEPAEPSAEATDEQPADLAPLTGSQTSVRDDVDEEDALPVKRSRGEQSMSLPESDQQHVRPISEDLLLPSGQQMDSVPLAVEVPTAAPPIIEAPLTNTKNSDSSVAVPAEGELQAVMSSESPLLAQEEMKCAFCGAGGPIEIHGGLPVHIACALFSPEVYCNPDTGELVGIAEAYERGKTIKCARCRNFGATIGCVVESCQRSFHYQCAKDSGCLINEEQFCIKCSSCRAADKKRRK